MRSVVIMWRMACYVPGMRHLPRTSTLILLLLGAAWPLQASEISPVWSGLSWHQSPDGDARFEVVFVCNDVLVVDYEEADDGGDLLWAHRVQGRVYPYFVSFGVNGIYPGPPRVPRGFVLIGDVNGYLAWSASNEIADTPSRIANCSARGLAGPGHDLIMGFVVGEKPTRLLVRGIGPGLARFGVPDSAPNPVIKLFQGNRCLVENDDWAMGFNDTESLRRVRGNVRDHGHPFDGELPEGASGPWLQPLEDAIGVHRRAERLTGAFALEHASLDAAMVVELAPGAYTLAVASDDVGAVLAEVYVVSE